MNKIYDVKKIEHAWLYETRNDKSISGVKNIIGIRIKYNGRDLFYSIIDDCFFRVLSEEEREILRHSSDSLLLKMYDLVFDNELFVEPYSYKKIFETDSELSPYGDQLLDNFGKTQITKDDIIDNPNILIDHFSDLEFPNRLVRETFVDFENFNDCMPHLITTEEAYVLKRKRPIAFERNNRIKL